MWWTGLALLLVAAIIGIARFGLFGAVSTWFGLVLFFQYSSARYAMPTAYYKDGGNGEIGPDVVTWMIHAATWTLATVAAAWPYRRANALRRRRV